MHPPSYSWRPVGTAAVLGALIGFSPFLFEIPLLDQTLFGAGLALTYLSIGVLVALLPRWEPRWFFGGIVGALYSLPGSILVAVPYPLRDDAPAYYSNFAAGGFEEFLMTMLFGIGVGLLCGLSLPRWPGRP